MGWPHEALTQRGFTMSRQLRIIIASLLLISPIAAKADIVEYSYTGFDGGDGWTLAGSILIDETDVVPSVNLTGDFISWDFTWTNGTTSFSVDTSNSSMAGGGVMFSVGPDTLIVTAVNLCFLSNNPGCFQAAHPLLLLQNYAWLATIGVGGGEVTNGAAFSNGTWVAVLIPDTDSDSVSDTTDNCTEIANLTQRDTDNDGIGNDCDADVFGPDGVQDCIVDFLDLLVYRQNFFQTGDFDTDNNGDNLTDFLDLLVVRSQFFGPPGPSANGCDAP